MAPGAAFNRPRQKPSRHTGGGRLCQGVCAFQRMRPATGQKVSDAKKFLAHGWPWEEPSYSSSAVPLRCSRRKGYTPHEALPPQRGTLAYRADANSLLREIPCHLDPEILRPSPALGVHRDHSWGFVGRAPVLLTSWQRTTPVPVVRPQQRLASKPKRNGANFLSFLRASDIGAHENRLAEPAHVRRDKDRLYCAYRQGARRNDGTQQNADRAPHVGWDRDRHRYNLKYLSRLLGSLFPWFPQFFRCPSQPSILPESWSEDVPQHQTGTPKPALHGSGRYSQNGGCLGNA